MASPVAATRPSLESLVHRGILTTVAAAVLAPSAAAQGARVSLRAAPAATHVVVDGRLAEPAWQTADSIDDFRQTDPVEGASPTARTRVQVLADSKSLVIGITCDESDPAAIVSFSVRRDAVLTSEDHVAGRRC